MLKAFLKKYMPDPDKLKANENLQFLGQRIHDPNLWHLNRRSVALAFAVGLFGAWIPTPGQMAIAAVGAVFFRANLPISVGLVWLTNPITMPPLFYFAYRLGLGIMDRPSPGDNFTFSVEGMFNGLSDIWEPFLLGCFIVGSVCASVGYFGIHYAWRNNVRQRWQHRQLKRAGVPIPTLKEQWQNRLNKYPKLAGYWTQAEPFISPMATKSCSLLSAGFVQLQRGWQRMLTFVPFE